jgi:hypothetical protein
MSSAPAPRERWSRSRWLGAVAVAGAVVIALLVPLPLSWSAPWRSKLLDLGHVPLFAAGVLATGLAIGRWPLVLAIAVLGGGLLEVAQAGTGRSGNVGDAIRSGLGALAGWSVAWCFGLPVFGSRRPSPPRPDDADSATGLAVDGARHRGWMSRSRRLVAGPLLIAGCCGWPLADAWPRLADAVRAYRSYPDLAPLTHPDEGLRWRVSNARRELIWAPSGGGVAVEFLPGKYSTVTLEPPCDDWSSGAALAIDLELVGDEDLDLQLVVADHRKEPYGWKERYNGSRRLAPGRSVWRVALGELAAGPKNRPLNLRHVRWVQLYAVGLRAQPGSSPESARGTKDSAADKDDAEEPAPAGPVRFGPRRVVIHGVRIEP